MVYLYIFCVTISQTLLSYKIQFLIHIPFLINKFARFSISRLFSTDQTRSCQLASATTSFKLLVGGLIVPDRPSAWFKKKWFGCKCFLCSYYEHYYQFAISIIASLSYEATTPLNSVEIKLFTAFFFRDGTFWTHIRN